MSPNKSGRKLWFLKLLFLAAFVILCVAESAWGGLSNGRPDKHPSSMHASPIRRHSCHDERLWSPRTAQFRQPTSQKVAKNARDSFMRLAKLVGCKKHRRECAALVGRILRKRPRITLTGFFRSLERAIVDRELRGSHETHGKASGENAPSPKRLFMSPNGASTLLRRRVSKPLLFAKVLKKLSSAKPRIASKSVLTKAVLALRKRSAVVSPSTTLQHRYLLLRCMQAGECAGSSDTGRNAMDPTYPPKTELLLGGDEGDHDKFCVAVLNALHPAVHEPIITDSMVTERLRDMLQQWNGGQVVVDERFYEFWLLPFLQEYAELPEIRPDTHSSRHRDAAIYNWPWKYQYLKSAVLTSLKNYELRNRPRPDWLSVKELEFPEGPLGRITPKSGSFFHKPLLMTVQHFLKECLQRNINPIRSRCQEGFSITLPPSPRPLRETLDRLKEDGVDLLGDLEASLRAQIPFREALQADDVEKFRRSCKLFLPGIIERLIKIPREHGPPYESTPREIKLLEEAIQDTLKLRTLLRYAVLAVVQRLVEPSGSSIVLLIETGLRPIEEDPLTIMSRLYWQVKSISGVP